MRNDKENIIVDKTIEFSLAIIKYCEVLEQKKKFVIAKQLSAFRQLQLEQMFLKRRMQKAKQILFIK